MVCRKGYKMRAKNYRAVKGQAYTRTEFVKGLPSPKITKFTMGDAKAEFEYETLKHGSKLPIPCKIVIEKVPMEEVKALE
jgi:ribosomal protein L16/L10AE